MDQSPQWNGNIFIDAIHFSIRDIYQFSKNFWKLPIGWHLLETALWGTFLFITQTPLMSDIPHDCQIVYIFFIHKCVICLMHQVLGANIVKSGSGTFTVYSIAVTDADNNSWSIKRRFADFFYSCLLFLGFCVMLLLWHFRFRHFEELHRLLRDFAEYNLILPPKHFLSSGLHVAVVKERCILLDKYLKVV